MIKLDEKDVKQIASSRFIRNTQKWFLSSTIGPLIALVMVVRFCSYGLLSNIVVIALALGVLSIMIVWNRKMNRAVEALVKEWKEDKSA